MEKTRFCLLLRLRTSQSRKQIISLRIFPVFRESVQNTALSILLTCFGRVNKMSIDYCVSVIDWVMSQPHRVKDITIVPEDN